MTEIAELTAFLDVLSEAAAKAIMPHFRALLSVEDKGRGTFDPVTVADRAGEAAMRSLINLHYPRHGIIGEEYGSERPDAEYVWVLDPIDGTRAFITGVPVWGILIGLLRDRVPMLGMMHQPFTDERFSGNLREATYRRGAKTSALKTRPCPSVSQASLFTTSPHLFRGGDAEIYRKYRDLEGKARLARFGCDCYAFAMVAMGQADIAVETSLQPYDIVALIPIVVGAGGQVTGWDGNSAAAGGSVLATGDSRVHLEALRMLAD